MLTIVLTEFLNKLCTFLYMFFCLQKQQYVKNVAIKKRVMGQSEKIVAPKNAEC